MSLSTASVQPNPSPKLRVLRDLAYVSGPAVGPRQRLDLYLPEGLKAPFPVLISAPGGGLVEGDKANDAHIGQRFAAAGFATAVINYRLSPEVAHPGHVEDLAAAVAWVRRTIAEYGGDPGRVFLTGHSAGAYLAALLVTDPRYLAAHGLAVEQIRGLIAVSGFYWVERVAPQRAKHIWGESLDAWRAASPSQHLHGKLPPALFVHADGDDADRRAQNIDIAGAAQSAGSARVESIEIEGRDHRSLWTRVADADDALAQRILAFLRAHGG
jgi:acetyl esterase/lipase